MCNEVSKIKNIDFDIVSKITTQNFNSIFLNEWKRAIILPFKESFSDNNSGAASILLKKA